MRTSPAIDLTFEPSFADLKPLGGEEAAASEMARLSEVASLESGPRVTPAEAFAGREGYWEDFLNFAVALPKPRGALGRDVLPIGSSNRLDYQHFSVVMSISRRMAMFVACNIDGSTAQKIERDNDVWFYDGRIPIEAQIGEELYVRNGLDRGHLVRREDPNWGSLDVAQTANEDTFHFTNCSPQMAAFNQRTWLGLENYVLLNAKTWNARVSVFTGPVFSNDDMIYRDVPLPSAYWKVLAFVHDSGRPSATAYMLDQKRNLRGLEAAYAQYRTYQRSVRHVERLTGLDFGNLQRYDGFSNEEERTGARIEVALHSLADARV